MKERTIACLNEIGIFVDNDADNLPLSELVQDSLTFITMIVELEKVFGVEIPDEYLNYDSLQTLDDIVVLIEKLKKEVKE